MALAARIAEAQARRAAGQAALTTPSKNDVGSGEGQMQSAQEVLASLQGISSEMKAVIAKCTKTYAPSVEGFKTELSLTGDPDIGTIIDASTPLVDEHGAALPKAFDECIRSEFQTLELPPMKSGDKYTVSYVW